MKTIVLTFLALLLMAGCSAPGTHERRGTEIGAVSGATHRRYHRPSIRGNRRGGPLWALRLAQTAGVAAGAVKDREEDQRYERGAVHAQPSVDQFGYTMDDYIALMTADEMEILQARAQARPEVQMGVLLTEQEKANLRRRSITNREIGR